MKMFVFENVEQVSDRYHCDGGLVIVAKDKEQVEELIKKEEYIEISKGDWEEVNIYELKNNEEAKIFVFPDAGCC